jgi:hypothetical protein
VNTAEAESQRRLDNLAAMLAELQRLQNVRLGSRLPDHLTDVPNPSDEERELGMCILWYLMASQVMCIVCIRGSFPIETTSYSTEVSDRAHVNIV